MLTLTDKPVRVRFAPSPTGYLHIGSARTTLLTWLFARHSHGKFILRIEDTDQKRFVQDALDKLMQDIRWLGLEWDEGPDVGGPYGPYIQSERLELYQKWAHWLVEQGKAYKCFATEEELARAREISQKTRGGRIAGYERIYRFISDEERAKLEKERGSYVIRFAMPLEGETVAHDRIRGDVVFKNEELSDMVLLKSDGFPTYHLAVVIDDHFMEISHVTRTEEWLPSLGLHHNLYEAFGWDEPEWVHMPVVLNPNGKGKMSKRNPPMVDGKIVPVMVNDYREAGYLPEALINFLTNVGYSYGDDQEIFNVQDTIARFDIDRVSPASAAFNFQKLVWTNGVYIRELTDEDLADHLVPFLQKAYSAVDRAKLVKIAPHIRERVNPLSEAVALLKFMFNFEPCPNDKLIQKNMDAAGTKNVLHLSYERLAGLSDFSHEAQAAVMEPLVEQLGLKKAQVYGTLRMATTAQQVSPPLFETMEVLGKDESLARIQAAEAQLNGA